MRLSNRFWLAWQVLRGRPVSASWDSEGDRTTIVFTGDWKRTWR